ncbi:MAG: PAS domain-containing protein [Nitrospiraceae bacterium]|nr:PAS domain-containing protein [Nitrospiraceae bacterium]
MFLISAIGIAVVITLLHYENTRRTLEEVKGLARNILQSIPTGILTLNGQEIITAVNPAAESVLKRPSAALQDHRHITHNDMPAECRRLSAILDTLQKFAGPDSMGRHEIHLQDLIEHIASPMRIEADARGITIEQSVDGDLPLVMGDETQISQVLANVIVNAFHAMPQGGRCRISACERRREGIS